MPYLLLDRWFCLSYLDQNIICNETLLVLLEPHQIDESTKKNINDFPKTLYHAYQNKLKQKHTYKLMCTLTK